MRYYLTSLAIVLMLAACAPQNGTTRVPLATTGLIAQAGTVLSVTRANAGIPAPLVQHPALQATAQAHADDLSATGGFDHVGSDGSSVSDRISAAGYTPCFAAENIARGQPDVPAVMETWIASPDHYRNIINASARNFGFARSGDVWVLVLARPC
ncbi:CAP domain-containing protein [Rhodobacterales bacterium HKCCE3408]|nr:CAP domain-containing protein [Rhodobacterales bacterium HKCCE3408]